MEVLVFYFLRLFVDFILFWGLEDYREGGFERYRGCLRVVRLRGVVEVRDMDASWVGVGEYFSGVSCGERIGGGLGFRFC